MSLTTGEMTPADLAAVTGNNNGFMNDGAWWIIILFLFAGWGRGGIGGGGGVTDGYVLTSDFANIERKLDGVNNGLCDGFYTQAQLINGVNAAITQNTIADMQNANAIQSQLASCCCENRQAIAGVNYNIATATNTIQQTLCNNTRDIVDNQNCNARAILDALTQQRIEAKDEKIATLNAQVNALNLAASQVAQNQYLINQLRPCPTPAYTVPNPYAYNGCGCGC